MMRWVSERILDKFIMSPTRSISVKSSKRKFYGKKIDTIPKKKKKKCC